LLDHTSVAATVTVHRIAVVAALAWIIDTVTTALDRAIASTAVSRIGVAVVALLRPF
jgi:hypothetical protein